MSNRTVVLGSLAGIVGLIFVVVVLAAGCQRDKPVARQQTQEREKVPTQDPAAMEKMPAHDHPAMDQAQAKVVVAEQTTCPVMGGPINKAIFVEYQGKKVYFCCQGCPAAFKADPEKYISKLPQFAK